MKAKYQVRYQHTSWTTASSRTEAVAKIKSEGHVSRLYIASVTDGDYCYLSAEDKAADDTGARAFAVICSTTQQAD